MYQQKLKGWSVWPGFLSLAFYFLLVGNVFAQNHSYDPHKTFDPTFLNDPGTVYRSGDGSPGPAYWQNRADYKIDVSLDDKNHRISGSDVITYTNNSPNDLHYLWLQLEQNLYKKTSRGVKATPAGGLPYAPRKYYGGYAIASVQITQNGHTQKANYVISDTRMQIRLPKVLKARGGTLKIRISYAFTVPEYGVDIMGRAKTKYGWIYQIGQWYPRMAVYDDVRGWNTLPFLGAGEFYLEYGNFDYHITAPADMLVMGSGKLQNPDEVLTDHERKQLAKASKSNSTVLVRSSQKVKNDVHRTGKSGTLTWHYKIQNARDAAWAASSAFVWDATHVSLSKGKSTLAMSVYPPQSTGKKSWGRASEFVKASLKFYSNFYHLDYPYPTAVNVAGPVDGMEYPGIVFCGMDSGARGLWGTTTHEFGHTWFPMIVGSNERRYAWMDEGFNTFANYYSTQHFNNGEFAHPFNAQRIIRYMESSKTQPIFTHADALYAGNLGAAGYSKPAIGLHILRENIVGPKQFDEAFRAYVHRWAYKHPQPKNFFRTMNNVTGENLNWFWKEWFYKTWTLDQAIGSVKRDSSDATLITIKNNNRMVMPVEVGIWQSNGTHDSRKLPVEIWQRGGSWTFKYKADSPIDSVKVDPENHFPDVNRSNNVWRANPQNR